jgi:large subunit ribosomal protein L24
MAGLKRIRKNDEVVVIAGRDRGKRGRVTMVDAARNRVVVEGINLVKRHTKPNPQRNVQGGIVEQEASIHASNVMLWDGEAGKGTRVGFQTLEDGRKVRISRKSGGVMDK